MAKEFFLGNVYECIAEYPERKFLIFARNDNDATKMAAQETNIILASCKCIVSDVYVHPNIIADILAFEKSKGAKNG